MCTTDSLVLILLRRNLRAFVDIELSLGRFEKKKKKKNSSHPYITHSFVVSQHDSSLVKKPQNVFYYFIFFIHM